MSFLEVPSDQASFQPPAAAPSQATPSGETSDITSAWGTRIPNQVHASIGSLSTGSAGSNNALGNALFRETVERERRSQGLPTQPVHTSTPSLPTAPPQAPALPPEAPAYAAPEPTAAPAMEAYVQIDPFANTPGNSDPLPAPASVETPGFTVAVTPEPPQAQPHDAPMPGHISLGTRRKRQLPPIVPHAVRLTAVAAFFLCGWMGYQKLVPPETKTIWNAKAMEWLEPGLVIFDFLPFDPRSEETKEELSLENIERQAEILAAETAAREAEEKAARRR